MSDRQWKEKNADPITFIPHLSILRIHRSLLKDERLDFDMTLSNTVYALVMQPVVDASGKAAFV